MTYGFAKPTSYQDPMIQRILAYGQRFTSIVRPGTYWVDQIPLLRYVPGYLSELTQWHHEESSFYRSCMNTVKEREVQYILSLVLLSD